MTSLKKIIFDIPLFFLRLIESCIALSFILISVILFIFVIILAATLHLPYLIFYSFFPNRIGNTLSKPFINEIKNVYSDMSEIAESNYKKGPPSYSKNIYSKYGRPKLIRNHFGTSNCHVFINKSDVIVVFRGSRDFWNDWVRTDGNFFTKTMTLFNRKVRVHKGFYNVLFHTRRSKSGTQFSELNKYILTYVVQGKRKLHITGHSLGGAVALIAALKICELHGNNIFSGIYTFGQPAAGNYKFAQLYNINLGNITCRFSFSNDIVSLLPHIISLRYYHCGVHLWYNTTRHKFHNTQLVENKYAFTFHQIRQILIPTVFSDHYLNKYRTLNIYQALKNNQPNRFKKLK